MGLRDLQDAIQTLAQVAESNEPFVSCYLNLDKNYHRELNDRVNLLKGKIEPQMRVPFWEAMGRIEVFLGTGMRQGTRSTAIFARGGNHPFFLPLQFETDLLNSLTVGAAPHIYNLITLRHDKACAATTRAAHEAMAGVIQKRVEMRAGELAAGGTFDCFAH
jgi:hypothetical protein